uniref:Uncharacterized protein ycf23 n=1 Tax=Dasya naccarioides TaxID=2007180 RepID=A0A1Z1MHA6_9FLOR|nr:hypothetical protein [Dasya naccarioides]ARW65134.1 hypothetical protein [Dasya naccarioides]
MNLFNKQLKNSFRNKQVIKVISGLGNLHLDKIIRITKAAELSHASYIDIVANTRIVSIINSITTLPICVSSIDPFELYNCSLAGADIFEIGNFDNFYSKKIYFSSSQILKLAKLTRFLISDKDICVTIPHTLNLYDQIILSKQLEELGVNILQTEGSVSRKNLYNKSFNDNISHSIISASEALSSTYAISNAVNIPVISSSRLNYISSSIAITCGAAGIGLASNLYKQKSIINMSAYIDEMYYSMTSQLNNNQIYILSNLFIKQNKDLPVNKI